MQRCLPTQRRSHTLSWVQRNNSRRRPVGLFLKGGKTAQLRSKTASSSTTLKVEVFLKGEKRLNFAPKQPLRRSTTLFLWSQRGHYAVTTRSLRSLRSHYGHYAVTTRSLRGHYTVTTRSLRSLRGQKEHMFEAEKTLNFAPKRTI